MNKIFTPSVNIIRDSGKVSSYTVTDNAKKAFDLLFEEDYKGISSFCIIGTYGTGKSAFLNAAIEDISNKSNRFGTNLSKNSFENIVLIGNYSSLHDDLAEELDASDKSKKAIINALRKRIRKSIEADKETILIIDEFGKYLEYAAKNEAQKELFLVQEIAEIANDKDSRFRFVISLHQNFSAYNLDFEGRDADEWVKVQGRFKEIPFNEPVQQLVKIAAERISRLNNFRDNSNNVDTKFQLELVHSSRVLSDQFRTTNDTIKQLYPFDYIAACLLCSALQKYGQNERSLFTFIETEGEFSLYSFNKTNSLFYNAANVVDYLTHHFYSFLNTNRNPDFIQWNALSTAIERAYSVSVSDLDAALKIIKTIGILDLLGNSGKKVDKEFLNIYGKSCLGIKNVNKTIDELESASIIRFINHKHSYRLFEGSDLNIQLALRNELKKVDLPEDISGYLEKYFNPRPILAKKASYERGIPRIFETKVIDSFDVKSIKRNIEFDGAIYLVFNSNSNITNWKKDITDASIFAVHKHPEKLRSSLKNTIAIQNIIESHLDDRVAVRELKELLNFEIDRLNKSINQGLFDNDYDWYFENDPIEIKSYNHFQKELSLHVNSIYNQAPIFKNELINRHKISASIGSARKKLFNQIEAFKGYKNLNFDENKNPPEKTIYFSLIKNTGIHRKENNHFGLYSPLDESFQDLWDYTEQFFERSKSMRRTLLELWDGYKQRPFGLKDGFIQYWISIVLLIKEHDIAIYYEDRLILSLTSEMLNLLTKNPHKFEVKAFSTNGIRLDILNTYRELAQIESVDKVNSLSYVDTLKPILIFYKELPPYTKQTKKSISIEARNFLNAIKRTKDLEDAFFVDFPKALGYPSLDETANNNDLQDFVNDIQGVIVELREALQCLSDRIIKKIQNSLGVQNQSLNKTRIALKDRFESIDYDELNSKHLKFLKRIELDFDSSLEWLNAVSQVLINKTLDNYKDEDELLFINRFSNMIFELDNISNLETKNLDKHNEIAYHIAIHSTNKGSIQKQINVPKELVDNELKNSIFRKLKNNDKRGSLAILSALIEDLIYNEE